MISFRNDTFTWTGHFAERNRAKDAGFMWHPGVKTWYTKSPFYALNLATEADISAKEALRPYLQNTLHSGLLDDVNGLFSPAVDPGYMPFQKAGVWAASRRLEKQDSVAIFDSAGCIDGEAVIGLNRGGKGFKYKLSRLYHMQNGGKVRGKGWNLSIPTYVRVLKDGMYGLHEVDKVLSKGVKQVLKLVLSDGKTLRLTPDHEVLTPNGWTAAKDLQVLDTVIVNGTKVCRICGTSENMPTSKSAKFKDVCRSCMYKHVRHHANARDDVYKKIGTDGYVYLNGGEYRKHPRHSRRGVLEHVFLMEQKLGRPLEPYEQVHHKNRSRSDNSLDNLEVLDKWAHAREHEVEKNFGNFRRKNRKEVITIPKEAFVVSCEEDGETDVYDIVMKDPYRNFVANGIVVHNCGKTIQAIGVLNELGFRKVLVICPAFLRNNWYKEMKKWWVNFDDPAVLFSRKDRTQGKSVICSYDLAEMLKPGWDCVIIDECHRLKNPKAAQTRRVLTNDHALIRGAKTIVLSGTPIPNGKPEELWTLLSNLAPEAVEDFKTDWAFKGRYCIIEEDDHGKYVVGAKNHEELGQRLRASGFMVRRLKSEVLTQLPNKRHNMIVVNPNSKARKLLEKESAFDLDEIEKHGGKTFASGLPELRRELGLTKIETSVEIIRELMESGADKILVGAHHVDVVKGIAGGLSKYCRTEFITGATSNDNRARYVQDFQEAEGQMALVGQIDAIGEGLTLTAASDCVQVEESWVPGKNDQFSDRLHRIGQKNAVTVHHIVYENSLDAKILFRHTEKSLDSEKIVG